MDLERQAKKNVTTLLQMRVVNWQHMVLDADSTKREERQCVGLADVINIHEFMNWAIVTVVTLLLVITFSCARNFLQLGNPERPLPLSYLPRASSIQVTSSVPDLQSVILTLSVRLREIV